MPGPRRHRPARALRGILLLASLGGCLPAAPAAGPRPELAADLERIFSDTSFAHAHWGVQVRSLRTGNTLYERHPEKLFVPASNVKILTGAAALATLGPEYRWRTEVWAGGPVVNGVLQGPLIVRGSGDPTLSEAFAADPREPLRAWADSLRAQGITTVAGPVVGVDSAFVGPPRGPGWAWEDLEEGYGAEFGALQLNEGVVDVRVVPSAEVGAPAIVVLEPATGYVRVRNRTRTTPAGSPVSISVTRDADGPAITLAGEIPADTVGVLLTVPVRDPTLYLLSVLRESLRAEGVTVEGEAIDADDWPVETVAPPRAERLLFTQLSPPLREVLPAMLQPSSNPLAETILRTMGNELRGEGSGAAGVAVVDSVLRAWELHPDHMRMVDGSGLSRYNLASPRLFTGVLERMTGGAHADVWMAALPVAGESGTLEDRMMSPPLAGNVRAKTGSMSTIRALSGYLTTAGGEPIAFSVLLNYYREPSAEADRLVEEALARIASLR